MAPPPAAAMEARIACDEKNVFQIDGHALPPKLGSDGGRVIALVVGSVIDEDGYPLDCRSDGQEAREVAQIAGLKYCAGFVSQRPAPRLVDIHEMDARPLGSERAHDGHADPGCATRYESCAASK